LAVTKAVKLTVTNSNGRAALEECRNNFGTSQVS